MHNLLRPHLPDDALFDRRIGLVETVIGRMVPAPPPGEDPLLLVAEPYGELPIARNSLRGPVPELPGLVAVDNFAAYEARKFFLHNAAHAALAYLGHERGHEFIWQCAADPDVQCVCRDALRESSEALVKEYGFTSQELDTFSEDLMHRFANQALGDTVTRVAADPRRKLRPDDRLLGAVSLCRKHGLEPTALGQVIASAHRYANLEEIA
jgi:mannitol-1-phosphate 5-dehydrogenase